MIWSTSTISHTHRILDHLIPKWLVLLSHWPVKGGERRRWFINIVVPYAGNDQYTQYCYEYKEKKKAKVKKAHHVFSYLQWIYMYGWMMVKLNEWVRTIHHCVVFFYFYLFISNMQYYRFCLLLYFFLSLTYRCLSWWCLCLLFFLMLISHLMTHE